MKAGLVMLLTFLCFTIAAPPPCFAKDVGKETVTKAKSYAITLATACENAVFAKVISYTGQRRDAATHDVAILTKPPTVEVQAKATVVGYNHRRLCAATKLIVYKASIKQRNVPRCAIRHIDPGLRGC